ncbi:MAG: FKBP-type peptidyl-prolyl cis-trans isomerase [Balneolaceae bacterium]
MLLLQGCLDAIESDYEKQVREADEVLETYIEENSVDADMQTTGVYIEVIKENPEGMTVVEDHVAGILYRMENLSDGSLIESHTDSLNPLLFSYSFSNSYNSIHPVGLNYEISKMKLGEIFRFYIPAYMAFGEYSHSEFFGPFTNFVLEVELRELLTEEEIYERELEEIDHYIESQELDAESYPNGLHIVSLEEGDGGQPGENSLVQFHFTRKYLDGTVIETTTEDDPVNLRMNSGEMVAGLNVGVGLLEVGDKALLVMPSKLAFGKSVQMIPQELREELAEAGEINPRTKPFSPVIYEVEVLGIN